MIISLLILVVLLSILVALVWCYRMLQVIAHNQASQAMQAKILHDLAHPNAKGKASDRIVRL